MPDISDAPKKNLTILSLIFSAPMPYSEGHSLTSNEAGVLNQTWLENLRNNYAPKIRKAMEDAKVEDATALDADTISGLQRGFLDYCEGYEFGVRGGREADPVRAQAMELAKNKVREKLKEKGYKLSEVGTEKIKELAEQVIEQNPAFLKKAEEIVRAREAADDDLSVGDIG